MKKITKIALMLALAAFTAEIKAQSTSNPAGYVQVTVPANSDAVISVPFSQQVIFSGAVTAVAGNQITIGSAAFGSENYANLFYVRFTSGAKEGFWTTVVSNTSSTVTVENASGVSVGDTFELKPHQTLGTVFPDKLEGIAYEKSTSPAIRKTEILSLNSTAVGINKSPAATYYYLTVSGTNAWRRVGSPSTSNFNNIILPPDTYVLIRNKNTSQTLSVLTSGNVELGKLARTLATTSTANDIYVASGRPVTLTLSQLNLGGTPAFVSSPSAALRRDTLLVYNNAATGQNKSPAATYYYINQSGNVGWRKVGESSTNSFDNFPAIEFGAGFIIRKSSGTPGENSWSVNAPY